MKQADDSLTIEVKGDISPKGLARILSATEDCLRACERAITGEEPKIKYRVTIQEGKE